jgi:hypothetical protein
MENQFKVDSYPVNSDTTESADVDARMIRALTAAKHHAMEVSGRDQTNALTVENRSNRVGLFVTSLRREIPVVGYWESIRKFLTQTTIWHDICQLKEPFAFNVTHGAYYPVAYRFSEDRIRQWVYAANIAPRELTAIIDEELRELESILPNLDSFVHQAERLNVEADGVMEQLVGIFSTDD